MSQGNQQWILESRPEQHAGTGNLTLVDAPVPEPGDGDILVRTEVLSLDPGNRLWMNEDPVYVPPTSIGEAMPGLLMGTVLESRSDKFAQGDRVMGFGTWSECCVAPADNFELVQDLPGISPEEVFSYFLSSVPTAYFGLRDVGKLQSGETLVVSAAAGAVGSMAVQLGKSLGAKVVGIAGGPDKCRVLLEQFNLDGAIDYKNENVGTRLNELCPDGIDCFFDTVCGPILDEVLLSMNNHGRIALCGATALYNKSGSDSAFILRNIGQIIYRRLTVQGFIAIFDFHDRLNEAIDYAFDLHRNGLIKFRIHEEQGLENALTALDMLFQGSNTGKLILRVN